MTTAERPKSLTIRCKTFFGLLPGQGLRDFADEMRALSLTDKQELCGLFNEAGMPTVMGAALPGTTKA